MQTYRINQVENLEITSKEQSCWEISLHHLEKDLLGEMNSMLWKMSRCQVFLFIPQSRVRLCLSQQAFSVGSAVLCPNLVSHQAKNSSNPGSGFPPHQKPAKPWLLLWSCFSSVVQVNMQQKPLFKIEKNPTFSTEGFTFHEPLLSSTNTFSQHSQLHH